MMIVGAAFIGAMVTAMYVSIVPLFLVSIVEIANDSPHTQAIWPNNFASKKLVSYIYPLDRHSSLYSTKTYLYFVYYPKDSRRNKALVTHWLIYLSNNSHNLNCSRYQRSGACRTGG